MCGTAIMMLKERFRNPDTLIQFHLKPLMAVEAVRSSRNITKLRRLHDTIRADIQRLEALGIKPDRILLLILNFQRKIHMTTTETTDNNSDSAAEIAPLCQG